MRVAIILMHCKMVNLPVDCKYAPACTNGCTDVFASQQDFPSLTRDVMICGELGAVRSGTTVNTARGHFTRAIRYYRWFHDSVNMQHQDWSK